MTYLAQLPASGKPRDVARTSDCALPAPTSGVFRLLTLLRRPVPVSQLRPAAAAAGMDTGEVDAAIAVATRRQAIGLAMIAGTACVIRRSGA